jgi:hypothetical protein
MFGFMRAAPAGRGRTAGLVLAAFLAGVGATGATGATGAAEIVVVAHPDLPVDALSAEEVRAIYRGELPFVARVKVQPVGYNGDGVLADAFLRKVVGMNSRRFNTYWIKEVFHSGRLPPRMVDDIDEMLRLVAGEPGAIGFVPASSLKGVTSVKRLYTVSVP